jgi:hypothetical protein
MKTRRLARLVAVACTAMVLALPATGRAAPVENFDCRAVAEVGGGEFTCQRQFLLRDSRTAADVQTHANFHALVADGTVTLDWYDQNTTLVKRIVCRAPGLYAIVDLPGGHNVQGGPADQSTYPNCHDEENDSGAQEHAIGVQTLLVRAQLNSCMANNGNRQKCEFHGFLSLTRSTIP